MAKGCTPGRLLCAGDSISALRFLASEKGRAAFKQQTVSSGRIWTSDQIKAGESILKKRNTEKWEEDLGDDAKDEENHKVPGKKFSQVVDLTLQFKESNR